MKKISAGIKEIKIGRLSLKQIWPPNGRVLGAVSDKNAEARVLKGSFGEFDWLLTADIGEKEEKAVAARLASESRQVEVLKVAHHGSKYSSGQEFLARVKPVLAVISVGKNHFGHPTKEVLDRLQQIGAKILRTDQDGEIVIVSDGKKWYVE